MMEVPDNSEQAVHMAHDGALAPTLKIKYFEADEKNKYPKIVSYELGEIPEYYAGMNRKKVWEDYDLQEDQDYEMEPF
jgi:bisphosphoglycerate-independent phosphoglycerate mutase (AlkP superfamily)